MRAVANERGAASKDQAVQFDSFDVKQRVKEATDIGDLVGSYLTLRREGRIFKALCPWHDDSRPSLQVNPERQSFKCWVCDIGGDVFSFLMKMEGISFPEALQMLADRAGITIERSRGERSQMQAAADEKRLLYQAMAWADKQFHDCLLKSPDAEAARKYFDDRGITQESIERFHLGYSPDSWEWLTPRARGASIGEKTLERVGLVGLRRSGEGYYDRFKGRVLFPIYDGQNRAVGIGGRVLPGADENAAKYVNSPETPLFSKHKLLYGLSLAKDAIRKAGEVLVMEGYTDCIIAQQYGFETAVAVLGTALGTPHIKQLNALADNVRMVLVLDGDEAGRRRAREVLELFVAENANLRILTLPDELDPCEFLLERGAAAFREQIDGAKDALSHAMEVATAGIDLVRDVHAASTALNELVTTIAEAPRPAMRDDHLREQSFLSRLAVRFRVPEETLRQRMVQLRSPSNKSASNKSSAAARDSRGVPTPSAGTNPRIDNPTNEPASTPARYESLDVYERELLEILLISPGILPRIAAVARSEDFQTWACQRIYARCAELFAAGEQGDFSRLLLEFDDPQIKTLLVALDEHGRQKHQRGVEMPLNDVLTGIERRRQEPWRHAQTAALREQRLEEEEELAFLRQLEQQERTRQGISGPTDG